MIKKQFQNTSSRFRTFLSLSIFYAIFIFYLSSQSSPGDPGSIFNFLRIESLENIFRFIERSDLRFLLYPLYLYYLYPDKVIHAILYAGFGFLLYYTLRNSPSPALGKYAFLFTLIIGIAYGASDEFHQSFVLGRTASIWDLAADSTGVLMAQVVMFIKDKFNNIYNNFSISNRQDSYK